MANIAFLPISPDLWEGFQTLYEDLSADMNNTVSVIPLPSYDKKLDGSLYNRSHVTDGYPTNVVITMPDAIGWGSIHFDIMYIQNVQDSENLGFSSDPLFYISNLRRYAKEIIYIPYHFMTEPNINNVDQMKDLLPFVISGKIRLVDKIIVQSENMKNAYIELLAGQNQAERREWAEKISWATHPRKTILHRYTKNNITIPKEWQGQLRKEDGSLKETIFLCTSVFGLLTQNRSLIRNTRNLFNSLSDKKEDITIIWRPYPTIFEIIDKMRPELVKDFKDLISFFKENNIGILDTSVTPTTAIVLGDKYVGDPCGVMELYKSTGKPVLQIFNLL